MAGTKRERPAYSKREREKEPFPAKLGGKRARGGEYEDPGKMRKN